MNKKTIILLAVFAILFIAGTYLMLRAQNAAKPEEDRTVRKSPGVSPETRIETIVNHIEINYITVVNAQKETSIGEIHADQVTVGENNSIRQTVQANGNI